MEQVDYFDSKIVQVEKTSRDKEMEFYTNCAIAAMQGLQESGMKFSLMEDLMPKELAKMAFNIADAMLEELKERTERE